MPKLPFSILKRIFLVILFSGIVFSSGYFAGLKGYTANLKSYPQVHINRSVPVDKKDLDFSLFWKVWDTVHSKYYDQTKVVDSELVYGAIRGMVAGIGDPYTVFLQPTENKVVEEDLKGSFEGIGIQIGYKGTQLAVMAPLPGSPAEKAGVKAGDYIVAIKDEAKNFNKSTASMTLEDAVKAIRGTAHTKVTLTLIREGVKQPIITDINREAIDVPSLVVEYVGDKDKKDIAHIRLNKFAGETLEEWEKVVGELVKNENLKAVIFDVRNNPGGYLQAAVELSSDFLETGQVVVQEEDYSGQKEQSKVTKIGRLKNVKMVVLMNGGSASASEIFSGAMRDNKRAKLIGEKSFGKGTIQEPEQIDGGAGLHITIARWLTPAGTWVHGNGLDPDVEVKDNLDTKDDEQLQKAIETIKAEL